MKRAIDVRHDLNKIPVKCFKNCFLSNWVQVIDYCQENMLLKKWLNFAFDSGAFLSAEVTRMS